MFKVKRLKDGRAMLNLACGSRMHPEWNNIDFSVLTQLAKHQILCRILHKIGVLSEKRFQRVFGTDPDIIRWDLLKGIPFGDDTFDVVYSSHFLEHLDRDVAGAFMKECCRVLKPSGIMRVVVPDLEVRCRRYLKTLGRLSEKGKMESDAMALHQESTRRLLQQMVQRELAGTNEQAFLVRILERLVRKNAAESGEIHRWMYDRYTLTEFLLSSGFGDIRVESNSSGRISQWSEFHLDTLKDGNTYKRDSIYVEAVKL